MAKPAPDIDDIFRQARHLLNQGGEDALSMRQLAKRAGCSPMSLYNHIGRREELLEGVVYRFFANIDVDANIPNEGSWQEKAFFWATQLHHAYLENPGIVSILKPGSRWPVSTTISSKLHSILLDGGFDNTMAISLCRTLFWQVTALSALEALARPSGQLRTHPEHATYHTRLASTHTREMTSEIFEYTLASIIDSVSEELHRGTLPSALRHE